MFSIVHCFADVISCYRYKQNISVLRNKEIISERSLRAVEEVIDYLKLNAWNRQMFQMTGLQRRIKRVAGYIHAGGGRQMSRFFAQITLAEVARGLLYFLAELPKPLLPLDIQTLALDAPNDIQPEVVASDILGLIVQDLNGRHLTLVTWLLEFMSHVRKYSMHSELTESDMHVIMLPVFFNLQPAHLLEWRKIASIFMEMVMMTPAILLHHDPNEDNRRENVYLHVYPHVVNEDGQYVRQHQELEFRNIFADEIDDNAVIHNYIIRRGNEGDANPGEIIPVSLLRNRPARTLINHVFGYHQR
ncbi:hypothetical protein CBL_00066 [Carabus blaptoides fortunei]